MLPTAANACQCLPARRRHHQYQDQYQHQYQHQDQHQYDSSARGLWRAASPRLDLLDAGGDRLHHQVEHVDDRLSADVGA